MTPLFSPIIERAIEVAAEWHDGTYRKSRWRIHPYEPPGEAALRIPTMAHLAAVAQIVQRAGWDAETVAAAFLHDAIEDPNRFGDRLTAERLTELMGEAVAERVLGVTEPKLGAGGAPLPWQERKEAYVAHLRTASDEAAAISLADKLHNAWTMNQGIEAGLDLFGGGPGSLSAGPERQRWYFRAVLDATADHADPRLAPMRERLRAEVERFEALTTGAPPA